MKPHLNLAETRTPDGSRFSLHEHDGEFFLRLNGRQLMSTTSTVSELLLADAACSYTDRPSRPRILIGGLGLGFSLKRVLELVGMDATVVVAELLPEVVEWNRQFLQRLNGRLLEDPRVKIFVGDVFDAIGKADAGSFDSILLDVDNGPASFVQPQNARLYKHKGFALIKRALRTSGRVAFWSADAEPGFVRTLTLAGFANAHEIEAKAHERARRAAHRIYVAERRD